MKLKMFAGANKLLFERAAKLRKQQTFAEEVLWNYLKTKPKSFKFRRQHVFGNYILDFYCHALRLAIEIDGTIHNNEEVKRNDLQRQRYWNKMG
jgi:very-short-patch-repair endonuclease